MDTWRNLCQVKISIQTFIISVYWKPSKSFSLSGYTVSLFLVVNYCETEHQGSLLLCVLNSLLPNFSLAFPLPCHFAQLLVNSQNFCSQLLWEQRLLYMTHVGEAMQYLKEKKICVKRRFAELDIFLRQSNCVLKEAVSTERGKGSRLAYCVWLAFYSRCGQSLRKCWLWL